MAMTPVISFPIQDYRSRWVLLVRRAAAQELRMQLGRIGSCVAAMLPLQPPVALVATSLMAAAVAPVV